MTDPDEATQELIRRLQDSKSAKRRSAALKLRKMRAAEACSALRDALERECEDLRTWETQYQMIMALGESGCSGALPLLRSMILRRFVRKWSSSVTYEPAVRSAIGDALVRLSGSEEGVREALLTGEPNVVEGAIRGAAMTRAQLVPETVESLIQFVSQPGNESRRFWVAAGAPGWAAPSLERFLRILIEKGDEHEKKAALAALEGKYLKWNPS